MASNIENTLKISVENRQLIHIPELDKYIGFIDITNFTFIFKTIGINRMINNDVVSKRVIENEDCYIATGKYYDFGIAELMIIRENNDNIFYIIDAIFYSLYSISSMLQCRCYMLHSTFYVTV
jgi:hypothetical protein